MLLRDRISIIFVLGALLLAAGLLVAGLQQERLAEGRHATVALRGQEALWDQLMRAEAQRLDGFAPSLAGDPRLAAAMAAGDRRAAGAALDRLLGNALADGQLDEVELVGGDGRLLSGSQVGPDHRRILDFGSLGRVAGGATIFGLWQASRERYLIVLAFSLQPGVPEAGSVTLAVDARQVLERFSRAIDAPAFLVNPRGRMVTATEADLWNIVRPQIPLHEASVSATEAADSLYSVTSVPVPDLAGGMAGVLVTLRDASDTLGQARNIAVWSLVGVGIFLVVSLLALHFYLRLAFRPLSQAIDVLRALAQGDTSVSLHASRNDEIGRIAGAVKAFRGNAVALIESRRQRERQRRRQERFIRGQMEALASSLDADSRGEILDILAASPRQAPRTPVETPAEAAQAAPEADQLGLLAAVLQQLSDRVVQQHRRLSDMVAELREALVTKTKLAGLQQELEIARQVQLAMVPTSFPALADFDVHGQMVPAREVGGDFYDFFEISEEEYALVVGDVSGKGVPAALFMAISRALIKATARYEREPGRCIGRVNDILAAENEQMLFVTLFYGVLNIRTGRLVYANAGHNPPLLIGADGTVMRFPLTGGMAMAVMGEQSYAQKTMNLGPGDTVFLYSDGVTEAFDIDENQFGEERFSRLLGELANRPTVPGVVEGVFAAIREFERGAMQADDITCLAVRRRS